ncbi:MAG: dephospho-CoA kinase [Verrucomicrobiae bacterium]|nr:dephospho-CoA kinase [Verrucomicrobiae bacterium]
MREFPHLIGIGLTGGIATGKSEVAALWQGNGAIVVDSDLLARRALEQGTPTYRAVVSHFGAGILNADGSINRAALADIIFSNETERMVLNELVHPVVRQFRRQQLAALGTARAVVVAVVPLLYEAGEQTEFDCVVVVACSEATQLSRLLAKGLSEPQARARIAAQWPNTKKMELADYVIWNDGSRRLLANQAQMVWSFITESRNAPK